MSAELNTRLFGVVERRLFRATAVLAAIIAMALLIAGMVWILGQALSYFYNLIMPLCVAGILALVLYPVVDYLEQTGKMPRIVATSLIVLVFTTIIVGTIFLVLPALIYQVGQFAEFGPGILSGWQDNLRNRFPGITRMITRSAEDGEIKEMMPGMEGTGRTVKSYAGLVVGLSFVPLLLFFALLSGGRLRDQTTEALSVFSNETKKRIMYFIDVFLGQVTGFFQGQMVIAVIMGTMFAIGFTLIGLKGAIIIGMILGLLNIVPFLGTLIGLLIVLPLAYFQPSGSFQLLGLALVVFTVVQLVESWLLTPKIMANRSGLHPALVVISVFFWGTALGGITGMILAVPLTAFLVAVWAQAKAGLARSMTSEHDEGRISIQAGNETPSTIIDPYNHPGHGSSSELCTSTTHKA